jgi:hypothetical protein
MPRTADELLDDLRRDGSAVTLRGSIAIAPHEKLTPAIKEEIRRLRGEIIELLRAPERLPPPPPKRALRRYQPHNPNDPFWPDPRARDAIEDVEAAFRGGDKLKGF